MNILNWFSAGSDTATKVLDAGIAGIDALILTEEERLTMQAKLGDHWLETQKALQDESTIRSVTRRVLSWVVMGSYTLLVLAAAVAYGFDADYGKFLLDLADGKFGFLVVMVGGFYFGPHMLGRFLKK